MDALAGWVRVRPGARAHRPADLVRRRWPRIAGIPVVVAVAAVNIGHLSGGLPGLPLVAVVLAVAQAGTVVLAWWRPWPAWWSSLAVAVLTGAVVGLVPPWTASGLLCHLLVVALLGLVARPVALALAVLAGAAAAITGVAVTGAPAGLATLVVILLVLVAAFAAVSGAQRRTAAALRVARRNAVVEESRRAVLEERSRIAREMHDVVAHRLSRVAVRAESAPVRVGGVGGEVGTELAEIAADAREAMAEMRSLLGVLRSDEPGPTSPVPGLADLPALLAEAGVGLGPVPDGPVPADVGLAAYRIVQEALRNAARHAPGAPVSGHVLHDGDVLRAEVRNGPAERPATGPPGHGVTGMRERALAVGGSLRAGPEPDGGWAVRTTLPVRRG